LQGYQIAPASGLARPSPGISKKRSPAAYAVVAMRPRTRLSKSFKTRIVDHSVRSLSAFKRWLRSEAAAQLAEDAMNVSGHSGVTQAEDVPPRIASQVFVRY
jgi:hypothetical protein